MTPLMLLGAVLLVIGAAAAYAEIHTLTFYLIPVALAGLISGVAVLVGFPETMPFDRALTWALTIFGLIVGFGVPLAHWFRKRFDTAESETVANDDRGNSVRVEGVAAETGVLRVQYRGSSWDAELVPGASIPAVGQTLVIKHRQGNRLVVG
jgi:membrane protein implicated in regulation of membrane protease activity